MICGGRTRNINANHTIPTMMLSIGCQWFVQRLRQCLLTAVLLIGGGSLSAAETVEDEPKLRLTWEQQGLYVSPYDFDAGDWKLEGSEYAMQLATLTGRHSKLSKGLKPATVEIIVEQAGIYTLWVNSLDFEKNQQGTRYFQVA